MANMPEDVPDINKNLEEEQTPETPVEEEETLSVEELSEKVKDLEGLLEKERSDKVGIVEQLKEVRRLKQEAEASAMVQPEPNQPSQDPTEQKVKEILKRERETLAKENRITALHKFWEKHSEFNPENDISGLKMDVVHQSLKRLNTSAWTVEDILRDYEDALKLMEKKEAKPSQPNLNQFATETPVPTNPLETTKSSLNPAQEKLRKEKGWTVKKYLEMKSKHPTIIL